MSDFGKDINVPSNDCISRRAAIDAMCELMRHWFGCNPKDEIKEIKRELDKLPSVQPELAQNLHNACADLISRQAAIDEIDEWIKAFRENGHKESAADACLIQDGIIQLPSAEPERKKGKWIDIDAQQYTWKVRCNQCGAERSMMSTQGIYPNYCEQCGADMRGEQE